MNWNTSRSEELEKILDHLIMSPKYFFDENLHRSLPDLQGIYAISSKNEEEGEFLRAGRTKKGALRQRVYQNHFMGDQKGNLRQQLVAEGIFNDLERAKNWIRQNCQVQWVVIHDPALRKWAKYYILSILRPRYCD